MGVCKTTLELNTGIPAVSRTPSSTGGCLCVCVRVCVCVVCFSGIVIVPWLPMFLKFDDIPQLKVRVYGPE